MPTAGKLSMLQPLKVANWGDEVDSDEEDDIASVPSPRTPASSLSVSTPPPTGFNQTVWDMAPPSTPPPTYQPTRRPSNNFEFPSQYHPQHVQSYWSAPIPTTPPPHHPSHVPDSPAPRSSPLTIPATPPSNGGNYPSHKLYCIVEFKRGRQQTFQSTHYIHPGGYVIVEGDRGDDLGMVTHTYMNAAPFTPPNSPSSESKTLFVRRLALATEVDQLHHEQAELELEAVEACREKVLERNLQMEIVDAEYQFDRQKLTFYYDAGQRQDFRDLCKDLYRTYRTRIWFSRVGATDTPPLTPDPIAHTPPAVFTPSRQTNRRRRATSNQSDAQAPPVFYPCPPPVVQC